MLSHRCICEMKKSCKIYKHIKIGLLLPETGLWNLFKDSVNSPFFPHMLLKIFLPKDLQGKKILTADIIFYYENKINRNAGYDSYKNVLCNKSTQTCFRGQQSQPSMK